ncbi:MAG: type II secretion system protein GspL [Myxococcales bacterium]|nr:type II secretion system protein GspL [Myxococcales bacterium]
MSILKNVLGLDVGSHAIKAVELQQGLRRLAAVQVQAVSRADSQLGIDELLARFLQIHRLSTEHVVTAMRGDRVSVRRLSFPFGERRRLAQAVPFEIEDQLPFDLDDVYLDWSVVGGDRSRAEVIAAVAPRREVSELIDTLHAAGCNPRTVECEGLVLANLTAAFDLPGHRLIVDLGHAKTTLCALADERVVAARSIGVAGRALTEAIAQDRGLNLTDAERAKCAEGILDRTLGVPLPKAGGVIEQIANEIVRFVASLDPSIGEKVSEITLIGGTAQLDRIDEILTERTGLAAARIGLPREEDGLGLVAGGSPVVFAPAIALALRGTARARTRLNFRKDGYARRIDLSRYRRDFGTTGVLAAAVAVLALVSFLSGALLESARARSIEGRISALYAEAFPGAAVPENPTAALRESLRQANERAEFLGVYRGNLSALDLLTEISRLIPADLDVILEEVSIDHQTIRMRVASDSFEAADRLGIELAKFALFAQTRIGAIETDRRTGAKRFNVTISLAPEGDRS